jgi:aminocarboxymuconate-semialdehyde decarboxylase
MSDQPTTTEAGGGPQVIDIHCHVRTPECEPLVADLYRPELEPFDLYGGASTTYNREHFAAIAPKLTDPEERLADMDRMGVDVQAISVAPPQYYYWTEPDLGARLARMENERVAELCRAHPDRFVGLGTVPLQDTAATLKELDHISGQLGFTGIEICTNVTGADLDSERLRPFWDAVADLDLLVVLHPHGFTHGQRLTDYYLANVIGNPLDSTVALSRLIYSGTLERHPDLKLCVVHGGGYLPFYAARMDHAWQVRPEAREHIAKAPTTYLERVHFDTVLFDPADVARLVSSYGADHVLLGTDYPYDMGESDPVGLVERTPGLSADDRARILGGNAARLLRLQSSGPKAPARVSPEAK